MPQLRAIRFEQVGHPDARLGGLRLDLCVAGKPVHTALWLRNGGGKSSILSVLFTTLSPALRDFLGGKGHQRRSLNDVVLGNETSHVAAEWSMEDGRRMVTGCVLERQPKRGELGREDLRRWWYAFRSDVLGGPKLDDLPVRDSERGVRRNAVAFLDALDQANHRAPACELIRTDNQRRWLEVLARHGLDPELFRYQLEMNKREGGAEELFSHVTTSAELVDLILRLAMSDEDAAQIATNLERYGGELRNKPRYELEATFLRAAVATLTPLANAAEQLVEAEGALSERRQDVVRLHGKLRAAEAAALEQAEATVLRGEELKPQQNALDRQGDRLLAASREARVLAAERSVEEATNVSAAAGQWAVETAQEHIAWEACVELAQLRRAEAEAAAAQEAIDLSTVAARPVMEELRAAAITLTGMLFALEDQATCRKDQAIAQGEQAEAAQHAASEQRAAEGRTEASLRTQLDQLEQRRSAVENEKARLVAAGVLVEDEPPTVAAERIVLLLRQLTTSLDADEQAQGDEDAAALLAREEAGKHRLTAKQLAAERDKLAEERRTLVDEAAQMASNPLVLAAAGGDRRDPVWQLRERLADLLRHNARRANRTLVDLEVASADDRRAVEAIGADGLLPPRPDVEAVLAALHAATIPGVAAWRYVAMHIPIEERAAVTLRHPDLADGVVVTDPSRFEDARRELALVPPQVASPVTIGLPHTFGDASSDPDIDNATRIVVPAPAALYNHSNGADELDRRRRRLGDYTQRRGQLEHERGASDQLAHAVDTLLARCQPGQLEAMAEAIESLFEQIRLAEQAAADNDALAKQHLAERQRLERQIKRQRTAQQHWLQAQPQVDRLIADLAAISAAPAPEVLRRQIADAENAQQAAKLAEEQARLAWQTAESERQAAVGDVRRLREEREVVAGDLDPGERAGVAVQPVDPAEIAAARQRHRSLRERYLGLVGDEALRERKRMADSQADRHRRRLSQPRLAAVRAQADELIATPDGADPDRADQGRQVAAEIANQARTAAGRAEERQRQAQAALQQLDPANVRRGVLEAEDLAVPEGALAAESEQLAVDSNAAYSKSAELRKAIAALEEEANGVRTAAALLSAQSQRLVDRIAGLEGAAEGRSSNAAAWNPERAQEAVNAALSGLTNAEGRLSKARARCHDAVRRVRAEAGAERFEGVQGRLRERLRDDEDVLIARAGEYAAEASVRLATLDAHLASLSSHEAQLVEQLCGLVGDAAALLRRAERASKLPDGLGQWSHQPFLRLRFTFPGRGEGLKDRMREVVAELVAERSNPTAPVLLQRAVHAAAGRTGFSARLLKPSAVMERREVAVEDVATASGGERLTAALLLFFLLVRLRAPRFGLLQPTYTLFADNPIGTCSSLSLLQLQRHVADSFNVQLVYATGVNDLDALSVLPKVIRLRNEHIDARTRHQHVTIDDTDDYRRVVGTEVHRFTAEA